MSTEQNKTLTLGSLFDGSGGFPLGGLLTGQITPVWSSEIEPFAIRVTTKRLPQVKHYGDVSAISGANLPPVDIITFGSPCQDMSIAGKRDGLDGSRSSLFYEAIRIVKEMRCKTNGEKPRFIVWENVPGAFSSNKGQDFKAVLEAVIGVKEPAASVPAPEKKGWSDADYYVGDGWSVAYRVLDAQWWGVPQRRKRIYLVNDFGNGRAGQILFECESVLGYHSQGGAEKQGNSGNSENSLTGTDCRGMAEDADGQMKLDFGRTADRIYINAKTSVTLMGNAGGGGGKTGLYLLPVYTIAGNVIGRNEKNGGHQLGVNQDIAPTLTGADRHAVAYAAGVLPKAGAKAGGIGYTEEASPTLMSQHRPAVVYGYTQSGYGEFKEGVGTLKKSRGAAGGGSETLAVIMERIAAAVKYRVRRLTPLECERLDGFPDEWTRYGASGKEMSDNARYMALGNSIAVPCAERVFIGIKKAESEE